MKIAALLSFLFFFSLPANANERRHLVARSSDLERELAYKLSVQDKHDDWRAQDLNKVFPINGPAPEYVVKFDATVAGKLKDLFGLTLTVTGADGMLVQVPLALRSKWHKENEVSVQFLMKKEMISNASLKIRCGSGLSEVNKENPSEKGIIP